MHACLCFWSVPMDQHNMEFSLVYKSPPLRGQVTRVEQLRLEATSSFSHHLAIWLPVWSLQSQPTPAVSQPTLLHCFLFGLSFMFWPLIITKAASSSLTGVLDCTIYLLLLLFCFLKDIHNLRMWGEEGERYRERLVTVQWKTSSCARLNKEGHKSCRDHLSPREDLNSLEKARDIYWKTKMMLLLPSCLSDQPKQGFISRSEDGITEKGLNVVGELAILKVSNTSSVGSWGLAALHSPAASQGCAET